MKKTANIWEHEVGINGIIANVVCEKVDITQGEIQPCKVRLNQTSEYFGKCRKTQKKFKIPEFLIFFPKFG